MHESTLHAPESNWFITLTYDQEHLPENASLNTQDWQKFAKRWRKRKGKFRFYQVGEYGTENGRPHHHAIVYGMKFDALEQGEKSRKGYTQLHAPELEEVWGMGKTAVGALTWQSASYCARYIMEKQLGETAEQHYTRLDVDTGEIYEIKPEYSTMSRRPGIGKGWIDKHIKSVYKTDQVPVHGGKVSRPPKYYDKIQEALEVDGLRPPVLEGTRAARRTKALEWRRKNGKRALEVKEAKLKRDEARKKRDPGGGECSKEFRKRHIGSHT